MDGIRFVSNNQITLLENGEYNVGGILKWNLSMNKLKQIWSNLRSSFWFAPSLIVAIDRRFTIKCYGSVSWLNAPSNQRMTVRGSIRGWRACAKRLKPNLLFAQGKRNKRRKKPKSKPDLKTRRELPMDSDKLRSVAKAIVSEQKGLLAADESNPTIKKRFDSIKVESTEETRRRYREILFTTKGIEGYIGGGHSLRRNDAPKHPRWHSLCRVTVEPGDCTRYQGG